MKKFEEIVNEIKVLSGEIQTTKNLIEKENNRFNFHTSGMSIKEFKKFFEEHKEEREESERVLVTLYNEETRQKLKKKVLYHNAQTSIFFEVLPVIIEVWNKYEGKRYGEKTSEKIRDEICERTNFRIYLTGYKNDTIVINHKDYWHGHSYEVKAHLKIDKNMLINNVIQNISMDDFMTNKIYVENVDVYIEELIKLYNETQTKKRELEEMYSKFNKMAVGDIKHLYIHEHSYGIVR